MMHASITLLNNYIECKQKAYYIMTGAGKIKDTASLILGRGVHDAIAAIESGKDISDSIMLMESSLNKEGIIFYPSQTKTSVRKIFNMSVENYKTLSKALPEVISVEEPFKVIFDDFPVVGRFDQIRNSSGVPIIVEFKTSKTIPRVEYLGYDLQVCIYSWAYQQLNGINPVFMYFNLPSNFIASVVPSGIEASLKVLEDFRRSCVNNEFYKEPNSYKCGRCDFFDLCFGEVSKREGGILY